MFNRNDVKKLTEQDIAEYERYYTEELRLTERRLPSLRRRQEREPTWSAYDPRIGEEVGIDIRIEEQEAVRDEFEILLAILQAEKDHRAGLNQTIRMF